MNGRPFPTDGRTGVHTDTEQEDLPNCNPPGEHLPSEGVIGIHIQRCDHLGDPGPLCAREIAISESHRQPDTDDGKPHRNDRPQFMVNPNSPEALALEEKGSQLHGSAIHDVEEERNAARRDGRGQEERPPNPRMAGEKNLLPGVFFDFPVDAGIH
jgi:hypothetical protein